MTRAYYTYRIYVTNHESVRVEKEEPGKPCNPGSTRTFRYKDKITTEVKELIEEVRKNGLNDANQSRLLGETLFDALLEDVHCDDFVRFYNEVVHTKQQQLRVELDIDERIMPEVAALPWEFMCLPEKANLGTIWLGTAPDLVFSRRCSQRISAPPIQLGAKEKLRIALVVSAPSGLKQVAYEKVQAAIEKLAQEQAEQVELLPVVNPANRRVIDDVLRKKPHIFHFIGHGRFNNENGQEVGQIALVHEYGDAQWISANIFCELFNRHRPGIIVLQACEGAMQSASQAFVGLASRVVQQNIPVVLAMQYEVSNSTASRFACHFYKRLAQGDSVDVSAQEGRREISLDDSTEYRKRDFAAPVIFMRVQDGQLFQRSDESIVPEPKLQTEQFASALQDFIPEPSQEQQDVNINRQLQGVKKALLIGVSEYGQGLEPLPGTTKDLKEIERILRSPQLGNFREVKVLINPDKQEMEEAIEELFADCTKDDLVLLFFSGHGVKDSSNQLYLATRITRKNPQGELVKATALSASVIHKIMNDSRSKRQVVILDCCFSGAFAEGLLVKDDGSVDIETQLGGEGRAILTSSNSTQYSFGQLDKPLSIYTQYLVEGIETGAADLNHDSVISLDELHQYIKNRIRETLPAMNPKIYAEQEGYSIQIAQVPRYSNRVVDVPVNSSKAQVTLPLSNSLTRTLSNKLLLRLGIAALMIAVCSFYLYKRQQCLAIRNGICSGKAGYFYMYRDKNHPERKWCELLNIYW